MNHRLCLLLAMVACDSTATFEVPAVEPGEYQSVIIAVVSAEQIFLRGSVVSDDGHPEIGPFSAADDAETFYLFYTEPLADYFLEAGEIPVLLPSSSPDYYTRPLPTPDLLLDDRGEPVPFGERLQGAHVAAMSHDECTAAGSCYFSVTDAQTFQCRRSCQREEPDLPKPPEPPEPVDFGSCPNGWSSAQRQEARTCAPPDRLACGRAQVQWLDNAACEPFSVPCPTADPFRSDADRFVLPGDTPGDGSRASPHASLQEALSVAGPGERIALAVGRYEGSFTIDGVQILGACAEGSTLAGSLTVTGDAALQHLTTTFDDFEQQAGTLNITDVELIGSAMRTVRGGGLQLERVQDHGSWLISNASLQVDRSVLNGLVTSSVTATLNDVVVNGALSIDSASVSIDRALVDEAYIDVCGGSSVTLRDVVIRQSPRSAISVTDASLTATRIVVTDPAQQVLLAQNADLDLAQLVSSGGGHGIDARSSRTAINQIALSDLTGHGLRLELEGGSAFVEDAIVRNAARGVSINHQEEATLRRLHIEDTRDEGVRIEGSTFEVADVAILRSSRQGIYCKENPERGYIDRVRIVDASSFGLNLWRVKEAIVNDLDVSGGLVGVIAQGDTELEATRVRVVDAGSLGIWMCNPTEIMLSDITVANTGNEAVPLDECLDIGAAGGAGISISGLAFELERYALAHQHTGFQLLGSDIERLLNGRYEDLAVGVRTTSHLDLESFLVRTVFTRIDTPLLNQ